MAHITPQTQFNPCAAELFVFIFHSFEAGISNAISSFEWRKIFLIDKSWNLQYWIIAITKHVPKNYFIKFSDISIHLKYAWNRKYAGQWQIQGEGGGGA